jgi:hypothetical protein
MERGKLFHIQWFGMVRKSYAVRQMAGSYDWRTTSISLMNITSLARQVVTTIHPYLSLLATLATRPDCARIRRLLCPPLGLEFCFREALSLTPSLSQLRNYAFVCVCAPVPLSPVMLLPLLLLLVLVLILG